MSAQGTLHRVGRDTQARCTLMPPECRRLPCLCQGYLRRNTERLVGREQAGGLTRLGWRRCQRLTWVAKPIWSVRSRTFSRQHSTDRIPGQSPADVIFPAPPTPETVGRTLSRTQEHESADLGSRGRRLQSCQPDRKAPRQSRVWDKSGPECTPRALKVRVLSRSERGASR
jgi:hypothetical protein